jgi:hypothetical protein
MLNDKKNYIRKIKRSKKLYFSSETSIKDFKLSRVNIQCCGSGSGIRCLFDPWIRDLGWVKNQNPDPG